VTSARSRFSLDAKRNFASDMRMHPTPGEQAMWELLRANAVGKRFRRQITLWGWIVDFYSPSLRLAIEVDGSAHEGVDAEVRDRIKDGVLTSNGIQVLRFENGDVLHYPEVVWMRIVRECGRLKALDRERSSPLSSSSSSENNSSLTSSKQASRGVSGIQNLCTMPADCAQLPENLRITPAEYEQLMQKVVRLNRQRSMAFCAPDNRSAAEKAADLRYRFEEFQTRKRKRA